MDINYNLDDLEKIKELALNTINNSESQQKIDLLIFFLSNLKEETGSFVERMQTIAIPESLDPNQNWLYALQAPRIPEATELSQYFAVGSFSKWNERYVESIQEISSQWNEINEEKNKKNLVFKSNQVS